MSWSSVERLFAAALEASPADRQALLDAHSDAAVRAEVRRLLQRHESLADGQDSFLAGLDLAHAAALVDAAETLDPVMVGRYEIVHRLGSGATGVVYLARDPSLGRHVALKLLSSHLTHDVTAVRRFTEEARAASRLDSPHIVAVHEIGRGEHGRLFIAMTYHDGETLRDRMRRGTIPVEEAVRIASEVADGLSAAHAQGIVHRDIKPENILLTARGACIVDFGLAKVLGETLTRTGAALGTAPYMSPEQTRGVGIDHRSDLWSLGVVLYEMLAGRRPFDADGGDALIYRIRHDPPEPVAVLRADLAPGVIRAIGRCLEKEPGRRFESAAAVRAALQDHAPAGRARHRLPWRHVGLALGSLVLAADAAVVAVPARPGAGEPMAQLSTVLPLPTRPGSIAVFSPSDDPSYEPVDGWQYITEGVINGIREELIRGLGGTPGVFVASRPSVRIMIESGADIPELGRRLGVATVLEWKFAYRDGLVTVAPRLVRAADRRELWSHVYTRPVSEVGAIPEEIRRSVAGALEPRGSASGGDAPRAPTRNLVAYDLYLRGQFARSLHTPTGFVAAADLFRQAIARDSSFGLAYVGVADATMQTWSGAAADRLRRVKPLIAKALEVDSTLAFAHNMMGWIAMWQDRDWTSAEQHLSRALALDSSNVLGYHRYASYLAVTGRLDESLALIRRATALDPVSSQTATEVGFHLYLNRRYPEAIAVLERALVADTVWWQKMPMVLGRAYLAVGRYDDAIAQLRRAGQQTSEGFEAAALLGYALGVARQTREATAIIGQYEERARASAARPADLVVVHLGVGDTARALDWLEQIPGDRGARFYPTDPILDPIRESARFRRVLADLGLDAPAFRAADSRTHRPAGGPS